MTTESILITKEFFFFEPTITQRVINPRHQELLNSELVRNDQTKQCRFNSSYDIEIFPREDEVNVFCNIKTKMVWEFSFNQPNELGSYQFAESLLFHIMNQKHFATTVLRQELINNLAVTDLLHKPNVQQIYNDLKEQYTFLAPMQLDIPSNANFSYWYR